METSGNGESMGEMGHKFMAMAEESRDMAGKVQDITNDSPSGNFMSALRSTHDAQEAIRTAESLEREAEKLPEAAAVLLAQAREKRLEAHGHITKALEDGNSGVGRLTSVQNDGLSFANRVREEVHDSVRTSGQTAVTLSYAFTASVYELVERGAEAVSTMPNAESSAWQFDIPLGLLNSVVDSGDTCSGLALLTAVNLDDHGQSYIAS